MRPLRFTGFDRRRAIVFALIGGTLPIAVGTATNFSSHHTVFFIGAAVGAIAPLVVTAASRSRRLLFYLAAFGGIPAVALMESYTGGPASGYSVLLMIAMVWFGLQATDRELLAGIAVLAASCYLPMLVVGAPAYPVSWGHATLLLLIGASVAGSLRSVTREMDRHARRLHQETLIDDLTGLLNRRGWRVAGPRELSRSSRLGTPVALAIFDLDHFKLFNDRVGHTEGDRILRETGERLRAIFRAGDLVARLGGDEFVALLTNSTIAGALAALTRLRAETPPEGSFSAGVAPWDGREDLAELVRRADLALYSAKARGGGATEIAGPRSRTLAPAGAAGSRPSGHGPQSKRGRASA